MYNEPLAPAFDWRAAVARPRWDCVTWRGWATARTATASLRPALAATPAELEMRWVRAAIFAMTESAGERARYPSIWIIRTMPWQNGRRGASRHFVTRPLLHCC